MLNYEIIPCSFKVIAETSFVIESIVCQNGFETWLIPLWLIFEWNLTTLYLEVTNGAMESKLRESEDHYTYVNMDQFDYDQELGFWKPRGSIGDK